MRQKTEKEIPHWTMTADYIETCNCDYGCPCNFIGFPTHGFCQAMTLYDIVKGNYGNVKVSMAYRLSRHITGQKQSMKVTEPCRCSSLKTRMKNSEKPWKKFSMEEPRGMVICNICEYLQVQTRPAIRRHEVKVDGKKSSFSVPGVLDVQSRRSRIQ